MSRSRRSRAAVTFGEFGSYVDASALRRRYDAALKRGGLRRLRFHDLRHTFGTQVIAKADIRRVQEWMGHADIQTTMKYLLATRLPVRAPLRECFQPFAFAKRRRRETSAFSKSSSEVMSG